MHSNRTLLQDWRENRRLLLTMAGLKLLIQLSAVYGYGYFRDEFYYLACARHLDFGYVDHPPLSVLTLSLVRQVLGESLPALRLLPALAGAASVVLTGLMTAQLGGRGTAQAIAMTAFIAAPIHLSFNHFYSMNSFDVLFWSVAALLLIRLLNGGDRRLWLVLGLVLGLGLQNKISVLWLGFGMLTAILATPSRRLLLTRWPWACGAIAAALFSPYLLWQAAHGWPTLEFMANATGQKMAVKSPIEFAVSQILVMNPFSAPLWLGGLAFFWISPRGRPYRFMGFIFAAVLALLAMSGTSRAGYAAAAYSWMLAGGAVLLESLLPGGRRRLIASASVAVLLALSGALAAPLALPLLPVEKYMSYARALGQEPTTEERKEVADLPQFFADMHGWEAIVDSAAQAFESLPPEERSEAAILAPNYGIAGAIDLLGGPRGLPPALSGHNNYWIWGPRGHSGKVMIVMGGSREWLSRYFGRIERFGETDCGRCMPYENRSPIWICREPFRPLEEYWEELRHFD